MQRGNSRRNRRLFLLAVGLFAAGSIALVAYDWRLYVATGSTVSQSSRVGGMAMNAGSMAMNAGSMAMNAGSMQHTSSESKQARIMMRPESCARRTDKLRLKATMAEIALPAAAPSTTIGGRHSQTKVIATVGPNSRKEDLISAMWQGGVDVFRIPMCYSSHFDCKEAVSLIRNVEANYNSTIGILMDLQGPKLRIGQLRDGYQQQHTQYHDTHHNTHHTQHTKHATLITL